MSTVSQLRNPFPMQGAIRMESANLERDHSQAPATVASTVVLDHVRMATGLVERYVSRYSTLPGQKGLPVLLRGDHGSGKTHTLSYISDKVRSGAIEPPTGIAEPYQLYAKADSSDLVEVFQQLMSHIDMSLLMNTADQFLRVSAAEQFEAMGCDESGDDEDASVSNQIAEDIRNQPGKVEELFNSYLIEEGAVRDHQAKEMEKVPRRQEFQSAFHYFTTNKGLQETAFAWLCGQDVGDTEGNKIGVKGPIDNPKIVTYAMGLLARLFKRVNRPIVFYIDQYEKLVLDVDGQILKDNLGALRKLVEWLVDERAMLVLAGHSAAWDVLTDDIKERFGLNVIDLPILTLEEARQIIALYLESGSEFEKLEQSDITPFTNKSLREILRYGGGNIRRLLQICSAVFDEVMYGKKELSEIGPEHVKQTLKKHKLGYFDRKMVFFEVDRILAENAANFVCDLPVGHVFADFAVLDLSGKPRILIDIDQAVFHDDEAGTAVQSLDMIAQARKAGISALIVRIVLGYVSPQITNLMEKVVHELIVYDPSKFKAHFRRYLDEHLKKLSRANVPGASSDEALRVVQSDVNAVAASRKQEAQTLDKKLEALLHQQQQSRQTELRERSVTEWLEKKEHILTEIRTAREDRARMEMEELKGLHEAAISDKWRRTGLMALLIVLFAVLFVSWIPRGAQFVVFLFTISLLIFLPIRLGLFRSKVSRYLRMPITSLEALDRLAHAWIKKKGSHDAIEDPDPHVRYAGALNFEPRSRSQSESFLRSERSSVIRRILAGRIGALLDLDDLMALASKNDEGPYLIEAFLHVPPQSPPQEFDIERLPSWAQVLFSLEGRGVGSSLVTITEAARTGMANSPLADALAESFTTGLRVESLPEALSEIDELRLRDTLNILSPLESNTLGSCDHLRSIRRVDEYYLFFRQLSFLLERGLLRSSRDTGIK